MGRRLNSYTTSFARSASRRLRFSQMSILSREGSVFFCKYSRCQWLVRMASRRSTEPARSRRNPLEKISRRTHLRIAAEFGVRNQPDVVVGDVVGHRDELVVLTRDEAGEHGDAGSCTGGGKEGVRAVGLEPDGGGGENRLEPLRLLQHLIRRRVNEQRKISQSLHAIDPEPPTPDQGLRRVQRRRRVRDPDSDEPLLPRTR